MQLTNWARCDVMLITTVIGLRYDTTPEQLRHVLARMRQVCFAHPKIDTQSLRVRFTDFGASSLDVTVRVYALANGWTEWYAIREDLYLRFMEVIEESGTSVAIPSRTLYLGRDGGLDPERTEAAERDVAAWREADELPFPYTPEPLAARITDTLDYPPKGSPEAIGEDVAPIKAESLAEQDTPDGEAPDAPHRLR
jgi:MscS family membrane protein